MEEISIDPLFKFDISTPKTSLYSIRKRFRKKETCDIFDRGSNPELNVFQSDWLMMGAAKVSLNRKMNLRSRSNDNKKNNNTKN